MKSFGLRLKSWLGVDCSWLRGFSPARSSIKFLVGIVTLLLPVTIFVVVPKLRATNTVSVVAASDTPMLRQFLREARTSASATTNTTGALCAAGTGTDLINFAPGAVPDPCNPNPCLNGGRCTLTPDHFAQCVCTTCYTGQYCDSNLDTCSGTITVNTLLDDSSSGDGLCSRARRSTTRTPSPRGSIRPAVTAPSFPSAVHLRSTTRSTSVSAAR